MTWRMALERPVRARALVHAVGQERERPVLRSLVHRGELVDVDPGTRRGADQQLVVVRGIPSITLRSLPTSCPSAP